MTEVTWNTFDQAALKPGATSVDEALEIPSQQSKEAVIGNFIKLEANPDGRFAALPGANIRINFVNDTNERFPPGFGSDAQPQIKGLAAWTGTTINPAEDFLISIGSTRYPAIPNSEVGQIAVNYYGKSAVTVRELLQAFDRAEVKRDIIATPLPDVSLDEIISAEEVIGYQGTLGTDGAIDYASRPSLSDFGWTRSKTVLGADRPDLPSYYFNPRRRPNAGYHWTGATNPDGYVGGGTWPQSPPWWTLGYGSFLWMYLRITDPFLYNNRNYVSMEFNTFDLPPLMAGRWDIPNAISQWLAPATYGFSGSNNIIVTISEKEGDFDPIQAPGCYWHSATAFKTGYDITWAGQDRFVQSWDSDTPIRRRFLKDRTYYLNMVGTTSPYLTPPARLRPQTRKVYTYVTMTYFGSGGFSGAYRLDNGPVIDEQENRFLIRQNWPKPRVPPGPRVPL